MKTTDKCLGSSANSYHNVVGTITKLRPDSSLDIMFTPDINVPGDGPIWALFSDEVVLLEDEDYWRKKYQVIQAKVRTFNDALKALQEG